MARKGVHSDRDLFGPAFSAVVVRIGQFHNTLTFALGTQLPAVFFAAYADNIRVGSGDVCYCHRNVFPRRVVVVHQEAVQICVDKLLVSGRHGIFDPEIPLDAGLSYIKLTFLTPDILHTVGL